MMAVCVLSLPAGADVSKSLGICEYFEAGTNSEQECEILYSQEDNQTILATPERLVSFTGSIYGGEIIHDGYTFYAYDGREYGYCFREPQSGVALCVTPYQ